MILKKLTSNWPRFKEVWETDGARGLFSKVWDRYGGLKGIFATVWIRFWMLFAGLSFPGRIATRLATWAAPPYWGFGKLARLNKKGFIAPSATIYHSDIHLGANICIDDRVVLFQDTAGGPIDLGERVHIHCETYIQTGAGGSVTIGDETHILPRCQLSAYKSQIHIGKRVLIAPNCAFYPYDHGIAPDRPIKEQDLVTKGGIFIGDDAWFGYGVIVLDGVRIGEGAVIGAGAVVTKDIPAGAIAFGNPARVVKMRADLP